MLRRVIVLAGLALVPALAACGEEKPSEEDRVRTTLREFARATAEKDYQALCDTVFARRLVNKVKSVGLPCEVAMRTALQSVQEPKLTVSKVAVAGTEASAQVRTAARGQKPSVDVVRLVKEDGRWRISDLAGQPVRGRGSRP